MKDLTQGPIPGHLIQMALPIMAGMLVQTLYYLVDLYFVGRLGDAALAGVGAAGTANFIVIGLTQMLGVGASALISHAAGRKDAHDASLIFNQSLALSAALGLLVLVGGYLLAGPYMRGLGADEATTAAGIAYLYAYIPGLALQFALIALGSALRGTGIVMPTMLVQTLSVLINALLAPVLIAGWLTGVPLGTAGAGLASSIAIVFAVVLMWIYFHRLEKFVAFHRDQWRPRLAVWRRILVIGVPAGAEFILMFLFMTVSYWALRHLGPATQAGYGVGSRMMQAIFLPAMAVAFATAPIAGQNFGARNAARVRETFRVAVWMGGGVMVVLTLICQWRPEWIVHAFASDPATLAIAALFLQVASWNFLASDIAFTCSGMFQALGNTWPSLIASGSRLVTYVVPALWLAQRPEFRFEHLLYLGVATVWLQAVIGWVLLRREFARRLRFDEPAPAVAGGPAAAGATH